MDGCLSGPKSAPETRPEAPAGGRRSARRRRRGESRAPIHHPPTVLRSLVHSSAGRRFDVRPSVGGGPLACRRQARERVRAQLAPSCTGQQQPSWAGGTTTPTTTTGGRSDTAWEGGSAAPAPALLAPPHARRGRRPRTADPVRAPCQYSACLTPRERASARARAHSPPPVRRSSAIIIIIIIIIMIMRMIATDDRSPGTLR
eukprot:scaffold2930_cov376-Prasinococcus_capsulatus_cf.AAC.1